MLEGKMANKDVTKSEWQKLKPEVRKACPRLSNEDLEKIDGKYEALVCVLEEKYKLSDDDARKMVAAIPNTPWFI
jgi:hypothetical protein